MENFFFGIKGKILLNIHNSHSTRKKMRRNKEKFMQLMQIAKITATLKALKNFNYTLGVFCNKSRRWRNENEENWRERSRKKTKNFHNFLFTTHTGLVELLDDDDDVYVCTCWLKKIYILRGVKVESWKIPAQLLPWAVIKVLNCMKSHQRHKIYRRCREMLKFINKRTHKLLQQAIIIIIIIIV